MPELLSGPNGLAFVVAAAIAFGVRWWWLKRRR